MTPIAIVLRGDRGLEPLRLMRMIQVYDCDRSSGRSRIGTGTELRCLRKLKAIAIVLRGDRGLELVLVCQ